MSENLRDYLLDSSLISQYKSNYGINIFDVKIVNCGDYIQVYNYSILHSKVSEDKKTLTIDKKNENLLKMSNVDTENLKTSKESELKSISLSNAIRSKLNCQRIAKSNINVWESFITLTFADNVTDIATANKIFGSWSSNIKKLKKDFKYLCVPEFQKRGAVHYHILSNLGESDIDTIILRQKDFTDKQLAKMSNSARSKCFNVRYWSKGFSRVDFLKGDIKKIIGYISKYMTEDIDNRLFGKKRYFYSQNIKKPNVEYLNLSNTDDMIYFGQLLKDVNIDFKSKYYDKFNNEIEYVEYRINRT